MAILTNTEQGQIFQLALEGTEGTPVAANRRLPDCRVKPGWQSTATIMKPSTYKFPTTRIHGQEWSLFEVDGIVGYGTIVYWLSSAGHYAAPSGAGADKTWVNTPNIQGVNTSKSYTFEWGVTGVGYQAAGAHVVGLRFHFDRKQVTFTARCIAKRIVAGFTLTAAGSVTTVENKPVDGDSIDMYEATTFANLTSSPTQLNKVYEFEIGVDSLYGMDWPLKSSLTSYDDRYELDTNWEGNVTALAQVTGADLSGTPFTLADMRAGSTINFLRMKSVSTEVIGSGVYTLIIDGAYIVGDAGPDPFLIVDGKVCQKWPILAAVDATSSKALEFTVINGVAAL